MSRELERNSKLRAKDAIYIGILAAITIVIRMIFMIIGGIAPAAWYASHFIDAILLGPVYMLLIAKVNKRGAVFIVSLITGIVFFTASYVVLITSIVFGILAELILKYMDNKNTGTIILSYGVFCYGFIGDFVLLWISKDRFLQTMAEQNFDASYINTISAMVNAPAILLVIVSVAVGSVIGGLFGCKLMKKHFVKAGIA